MKSGSARGLAFVSAAAAALLLACRPAPPPAAEAPAPPAVATQPAPTAEAPPATVATPQPEPAAEPPARPLSVASPPEGSGAVATPPPPVPEVQAAVATPPPEVPPASMPEEPRPREPAVEGRRREAPAPVAPAVSGPGPQPPAPPQPQSPQPPAPPPVLEIAQPPGVAYYRSEIRVDGRVADSEQEPKSITAIEKLSFSIREYPALGGEIFYNFVDGTFRLNLPAGKIKGRLTVELRVQRKEGTATVRSVVLYDGTVQPMVQVDSPADGSRVGPRVLLAGRAWDPSPDQGQPRGIRSLTYELQALDNLAAVSAAAAPVSLDAQGGFGVVLDAAALSGRQELVLIAESVSGNRVTRRIAIERGQSAIPSFSAEGRDGSAVVSWEPVPLAGRYTLHYTDDGSAPSATAGRSLAGASSPITVPGLQNGQRYRFALSAEIAGLGSEWSEVVDAIPVSPATLAPTVLGEYRQIRVRWQGVPGAREYQVFRASSRQGPFLSVGRTAATEILDRRVRTGERYYYSIAPAAVAGPKSDAVGGEPGSIPDDRLVAVSSLPAAGARALAVLGDYAIVLDGKSLSVIDIFDLAAPTASGRLALESPTAVAVADTWAFVAEAGRGLKAVDLSSPADPRSVSSINLAEALGVATYTPGKGRSWAYVAAGDYGIAVVDIRDPAHLAREPVELPGSFAAVTVAETAAGPRLLAAGRDGLAVFDLADPAIPRAASTVPIEGARAVVAHRRDDGRLLAYVCTKDALHIVDLAAPGAPQRITSVAADDLKQAVIHQEPDGRVFAHLADGTAGIKVVDVTDPATPRAFGDLSAAPADAIALRDDFSGRAYALTAGAGGFAVVDVFTQGRSLQVASAATGGKSTAVALGSWDAVGDVIAVADDSGGVKVFAASDPAALKETSLLGSLATDNAVGVEMSPDPARPLLFVADRARGVRVIALEREGGRTRLRNLVSLETGGDARAVALQSQGARLLAYAADAMAGLIVFDSTDASAPRRLSSVAFSGAQDVALSGSTACVARGLSGLEIIDVSDPASPVVLSRLGSLHARTVSVGSLESGVLLAAVTGSAGLSLIDLSDPRSPRELSIYRSRYAEDALLQGSRVYLAEGIRGLAVLDVSRPDAPRRVSSSELEYAISVAARGEYAFVVDGKGLRVVRVLVPDWLVGR